MGDTVGTISHARTHTLSLVQLFFCIRPLFECYKLPLFDTKTKLRKGWTNRKRKKKHWSVCVCVCLCECVWWAGRKGVGGDGRLIHGTTF